MNNAVKTSNSSVRDKSEFHGFYKKNEEHFLNYDFYVPDQFFQGHISQILHMKEVDFLTDTQWGVAKEVTKFLFGL